MAAADPYRDGKFSVDSQVDSQCQYLACAGGDGGTFYAQLREGAKAKDQHRVQEDVCDTPGEHAQHGQFHPSYSLKYFLEGKPDRDDHGKGEGDHAVAYTQVDDCLVSCEHAKKPADGCNADQGKDQAVDGGKEEAAGGGSAGPVLIISSQLKGDLRVDAHAKADGHRVDQVLQGIDQ